MQRSRWFPFPPKQRAVVAAHRPPSILPPMSTRSERLIYRRELTKRVGLSYPTIWKQMRDGKFPRGRAVGGKTAWLESEIDSWIAGLPERRLKGDPPERDTSDLQPDPDTADTAASGASAQPKAGAC